MNWLELFYKNKIVFLFVAYLQLWVNFKVGQRLGWHMASKRARLSITYLLFCPNAENTAPSSRTHVINDGLSPVANKMPSRPLSENIKIQCSDFFSFLPFIVAIVKWNGQEFLCSKTGCSKFWSQKKTFWTLSLFFYDM